MARGWIRYAAVVCFASSLLMGNAQATSMSTDINLVIGAFNGGGIHVIYDTDGAVLENTLGISSFGALGVE